MRRPWRVAAGLDPVPRVWLVGDNIINAFATYGDRGENMFIFCRHHALAAKAPNELIGVMAHETGPYLGGPSVARASMA
jgi:predicted Zn-dependent protease